MLVEYAHKPELLLPAGDTESFFAAVEAGADAVYLGAKQFNARERAVNFSPAQLKTLVNQAHDKHIAVYITLNTVIKNCELDDLLDLLFQLQQTKPDALIVQDCAVWYVVKKFFPEFELHASTQMGNHNSAGTLHAKQNGIKRVIMARELTLDELKHITQKHGADSEVFVHGALCYAFSGMCLFSSYLGGMSANRGQCKQACRRIYHGNTSGFLFSLKDNQAIDFIPEISKMGIKSLKVEGRMKPAEYVYRVGSAYRMAIDDHNRIPEAKTLLDFDLGREKTTYFLGQNNSNAISDAPATGKFLGNVCVSTSTYFEFESDTEIANNYRLRIVNPTKSEHISFKIKKLENTGNTFRVYYPPDLVTTGDEVYLANIPEKKFPTKFEGSLPGIQTVMPAGNKAYIKKQLHIRENQKKSKSEIIVRIDQLAWLPKVDLRNIDMLLLDMSSKAWDKFDPQTGLIQKFKHKIAIELPKFIPENKQDYFRMLTEKMYKAGIKQVAINHLSQKLLCPKNARFIATENVYTFSDVAILALIEQGVYNYIRPLENDFDNLKQGKDRDGIIPVYFHPHLFISRMPVKTGDRFTERSGVQFLYRKKEGISYVIPENPVSLTQYYDKLKQAGFYRFLIDLSYIKPSSNKVKTIQKRLYKSQQIQPSTNFIFTKGLN
ncbi:MAG: U32 family peptidase [Candidatus Delongbacteria bacterium]|jgi:putative protease|nr:U32 family peptidase [Candidatus Delongbacteria bacterium]